MREVTGPLCRGRDGRLAGVALRVAIAFQRDPEEGPVLALIDFGDPNGSAKTAVVGSIGLIRARNATCVVEERVGLPVGVTQPAAQTAVVLVGARPHQDVEDAAAGTPHLG